MTYKIAVTKSGYNVLSESDQRNYIFDSEYNTFKIIASGTLTSQTVDADPKTFTVAHNQASLPAVFAFAEFPDGYVALPNQTNYNYNRQTWWKITIDNTNINFIFYRDTSDYDVDISYYIFEAPGS